MKYSIKEIKDNIIAIVVPNDYERAMLFCRIQEFYESPNKSFKDSKFSIWDYFSWYSKTYGKGCFSYPKDFVGYNLPIIVAKKCYESNKPETPYDLEMIKIIDSLYEDGKRKYLIGVDDLKNSVFDHELAHAFFYTNLTYQKEMIELIKKISKSNIKKLRKNLKNIGYCSEVFKDEVQAYMSTEINKKVTKGVLNKDTIHKRFKHIFNKYLN